MRLLLVGGTGRSGTSFVYKRILECTEVCGFPEFESGLFTADISLVDVFDRYTRTYSPERFRYISGVFSNFVKGRFNLDNTDVVDDFFRSLYRDRSKRIALDVSFQVRVRELLEGLFKYDRLASRILLEKTPHNVLMFDTIKSMVIGAKLIHVVRDPRAVAESVVRQSWGPNDYESAVIWVRSILDAWIRKYKDGSFIRTDFECFRIEDMITKYNEIEDVTRRLVGETMDKLSLKASPRALDGWSKNITDEQIKFGNEKLKEVMDFFKYDARCIGSAEQAEAAGFKL